MYSAYLLVRDCLNMTEIMHAKINKKKNVIKRHIAVKLPIIIKEPLKSDSKTKNEN